MIDKDITCNILLSIEDWISARTEKKDNLSNYKINRGRLEDACNHAEKEIKTWYAHLPDPSPIKLAACICFGLLRLQPLCQKDAKDDMESSLMVALDNARLAFDVARYFVSRSKFSCAKEIAPPFKVNYPSRHFKHEITCSLVCVENMREEVTVAGIAYILELLLYRCPKGAKLMGRIDKNTIPCPKS